MSDALSSCPAGAVTFFRLDAARLARSGTTQRVASAVTEPDAFQVRG